MLSSLQTKDPLHETTEQSPALPTPPRSSQEFSTEIATFLKGMRERRAIDQKAFEYLMPTHVRPARFYLLPKIHQPGNPGRPIVSSCGAPTEISHFVDYHLRPHVQQLPSYLKDTTDFLCKLRAMPELPPGTLLLALDVTSLYTNIPHKDGITACEEALLTRTLQEPPTADLVQLIRFILTKKKASRSLISISYRYMALPWV